MATVYLVNNGSENVYFTKDNCWYSGTTLWCTTGSQSTAGGSYKYTYNCPSGSRAYFSCSRSGWGSVYDAWVSVAGTQIAAIGSSINTSTAVSGDTTMGFDFYVNGWNSGGAGVALGNPTIYITYTQKYTVTVQAGTGISSVSGGGTVNEGSSVSINATVSTGYKWYRWESNGSSYTTTKNASVKPTSNLTLTAVGQPITYTITYNSNGGSGSMSSTSATYGTYVTLRANTFTKDKYIFKGWATSSGGSKTYDNQQSVRNLSTTQGATVTLYAVWEKDPNAVFVNSTKVYASGWK